MLNAQTPDRLSKEKHPSATGASPRFGCVEAGGTKFAVAVIDASGDIEERVTLPTRAPAETLGAAVSWLRAGGPLQAVGVGTFGPIDATPGSKTFGRITATPKPGWSGTDVRGAFAELGVPVGFDTDVNGAALAESLWGAAKGDPVCVYITVGTGIGGGLVVHGRPVHGSRHPEMGHMLVRRLADDLDFAGTCPFHGDCLEGLASGPAIMARWGCPLSQLPTDHPGHEIIAGYLGQLAVTVQAMLSPPRILVGGGVMATPGLLSRTQAKATELAGGYFDPVLQSPGLGDDAGLLGALALAQAALAEGVS